MKNTDIYLLNNIQQENIIYSELDDIINNVKSTKIGNIIYFLKTTITKSDKVILFSQWDELLNKVGHIIEKYNIKPLYCTGTVYQKKRVIDQFSKDNECNLIMLSSNNCASGLNLTIANKIIFLEPIYGSKEYRSDIQSQAIGRCDRISQKRPIEIYNFIIKNTIEEDIINDSIDDSNIENINLI
jgi:SNF2 family DNA or RNA helicase